MDLSLIFGVTKKFIFFATRFIRSSEMSWNTMLSTCWTCAIQRILNLIKIQIYDTSRIVLLTGANAISLLIKISFQAGAINGGSVNGSFNWSRFDTLSYFRFDYRHQFRGTFKFIITIRAIDTIKFYKLEHLNIICSATE